MEKIKKMKLSIPFKWVAITAYAILIAPIISFFRPECLPFNSFEVAEQALIKRYAVKILLV